MKVYTERGTKRVFAGALDWPGWCRSGPNDAAALEALVAYGPRYAEVLTGTDLAFPVPTKSSSLTVAESLEGDATTDFGAPSIAPAADVRVVKPHELARLRTILEACWVAFDKVAQTAVGRELSKGPRGGGRDLQVIIGHVVGAEASYLRRLAATPPPVNDADAAAAMMEVRETVLDALTRAVEEGLPAQGPRGGRIWSPRYFVRRTMWHVLDHAWEIEDRSAGSGGLT